MAIIITGTPGTGKTTFARDLAEQEERPYINITGILKQRGLDSEWDDKRQCFLVDVPKLTSILEDIAKSEPSTVIDGHLSHYLNHQYVERCIVMKCDLKVLKKRLEERDYSDDKVRENLDCEIFDVCFVEAQEQGHEPEVVWSS